MLGLLKRIINRKFYRNSFLGFSLYFFLYPFIHRIVAGYFSISYHFDDAWVIMLTIFKHDCLIIAALLILYILSSITKRNGMKITLRSFMCGILFLYCLDLAAIKIFSTRLSFNDLFQYLSDIGYVPSLLDKSLFSIFIILVILLIMIFSSIVFFVHNGPQNKKILGILTVIAIITAGYYLKGNSNTYFIHNWMFKNFIEINLGRGLDTPFSENFKFEILKNRIKDEKNCEQKERNDLNKKNIMLLILESFSMYHSKFFSGINDYTPHLDEIAGQGRVFTNFLSNGFTTEHALISVFTGKFPIPNQKESQYNFFSDSFKGYYNLENALPKILTRNGYYCEFLTTGHLGFSNKGTWLKNIGFDYIEGHDADYYKNFKKFHFEAAPDDALYARVLDRLRNKIIDTPFFIAIETVSTHLPFIDPITEARSESLAVRFADNALGNFYSELNESGFFDNGILIIISDHRSMTLMTEKEIEKFGVKAAALVPMIISGKGYTGVENKLFQQTDIFTSIGNYVSNTSCTSIFTGDFLHDPATSPIYALYVRGDDRSLIDVFGKKATGTIRLEGDQTRLVTGGFEGEAYVVRKINYDRISNNSAFSKQIDADLHATEK